ncbi:tyrosine-type recombinase/integrase [Martelella soudanensis]|uniref:tyrosine-type recombinase/integrase n=1 Tax=unclassified Martelella TaxID=2629616 RepID=UPI001FEFD261|nr:MULTISPECIES: tyrosine-type recombinase/integrase [unclassified Martelella]
MQAKFKEPLIWAEQIEAWEARLAGDSDDAEARFQAAAELAQRRGYRYLTVEKVAQLPRTELLERIETTAEERHAPRETAALLGGVTEPLITVERALELYWSLAKDRAVGKSEDQLHRWRNPRIKAIRNFIGVCGNLPINEISGDVMLDFRAWWVERVDIEGMSPDTANKDFTHLGDVLKTVNNMKRLGLVLPLTDIALKSGEAKTRPPFSNGWIRDQLLRPGALDGLNDEARAIFLAMINTGARPSELAGLTPGEIHLDADIPHISIKPIGRKLKSGNAKRTIPLLGVSLEAMRQFPDGFGRYRKRSAGLSGTINKFLRENGLCETPAHTLYCLRHSFEDRMFAAGIDERIRRDLMGHTLNRERYGAGASLEQMSDLLQPLSF